MRHVQTGNKVLPEFFGYQSLFVVNGMACLNIDQLNGTEKGFLKISDQEYYDHKL